MILRGTLLRSLSQRLRAEQWWTPHPEILAEPHRAADRGRRHDALGHHAAPAGAGQRPPPRLRLRLGGRRAGARDRAGIPPPPTRGSPTPRRGRSRPARSRPSCSPSTRPTSTRPRRRSSSWPTRSCRTSPRRRATCRRYRSWVDTPGLRAGLPVAAADAPAAPVAEAAAGRAAAPVRAQDAGAPRLPRHPAGRVPRRPHRAHPPRPGRRDPVGRVAQHHAVADPLRRRRSPRGRTPVDRAHGLVVRPRRRGARPDPGRRR